MFGGIALGAKGGAQPIGTIDIRAAALHLRGAFGGPMGIDGGLRRVERVVVPVGHPFIEIAGQVMDAIGLVPLSRLPIGETCRRRLL